VRRRTAAAETEREREHSGWQAEGSRGTAGAVGRQATPYTVLHVYGECGAGGEVVCRTHSAPPLLLPLLPLFLPLPPFSLSPS
jgi:hypothetical protein